MGKLFCSLFFLLLFGSVRGQTSDDVLSKIKEIVDTGQTHRSISVAVVDEKGIGFFTYGKSQAAANADVTEHSLFEIGSVTKSFTGILLAEAVRLGEVKVNDPIALYLPKDVKTPTRNGRQITLLDLVNHTAALPKMPDNFSYSEDDPGAVFERYTVKDLYEFLGKYELPYDIGTRHEYSNVGVGLLGHILSLRAKMPYERLLKKRILDPLKMNETFVAVPGRFAKRLVVGHNAELTAVSARGDSLVFMASGGIRSTPADMAKFVAANLGLGKSSIASSMEASQVPNFTANKAGTLKFGYAWHIYDLPKYGKLIWHSGMTIGFSSLILFDKEKKRGVVVLSNTASSVDQLAFNVFDPKRFPKQKVVPVIDLPESALEQFLGVYEIAPSVTITVTREGRQLYIQASGQDKVRAFAKNEREFFLKVDKAEIAFNLGTEGKVVSLTLKQDGEFVAKKIR